MRLGELIKTYRESSGQSIVGFSRQAGVHDVGRFECGDYLPPMPEIITIAKYMNLSSEVLFKLYLQEKIEYHMKKDKDIFERFTNKDFSNLQFSTFNAHMSSGNSRKSRYPKSGLYVREWRKKRGLSRDDFCKITHRSHRDIRNIENGKVSLSPTNIFVLSAALRKNPHKLFNTFLIEKIKNCKIFYTNLYKYCLGNCSYQDNRLEERTCFGRLVLKLREMHNMSKTQFGRVVVSCWGLVVLIIIE